MGTTADKLNKLLETKQAIKQAIIDKGVDVSDDTVFAEYPALIDSIEVGGGSDDFLAMRTQNGTDFRYLFYNYSGSELNLNSLDTSNVNDMNCMFSYCNNLTTLDLSNFDTSNVTNIESMFSWCYSLEELDIRNFNVNNIEYVNCMFEGCRMLHTLRLDNCSNDTINKIINSVGFPTGQVNVDGEYINRKIYVNPDNIEGLEAPENWKFYNYQTGEEIIDKVEDPFADYSLVIKADDEKLVTDNFGNWSNTTSYFFTGEQLLTLNDFEQVDDCYAIKFEAPIPGFMTIGIDSSTGEPDMTSVNSMTELVKFDIDTTVFMFMNCMFLKSIDLSHIDTSGLETISMMFAQCLHLEEIDIRNFDLTHMDATAVDNTFTGCPLHTLRLDNCNTDTINKIINSTGFPTGNTDLFGNPITQERKIYCKEANADGLTAPDGWSFEFVD